MNVIILYLVLLSNTRYYSTIIINFVHIYKSDSKSHQFLTAFWLSNQSVSEFTAGGKPSTLFPPERLVWQKFMENQQIVLMKKNIKNKK